MNTALGLDVGGTGTKGAIVDLDTGTLITDRVKFETPQPATPEALRETIKSVCAELNYSGDKVGVGFPCIIKNQISFSASNIDNSWKGKNLFEFFSEATGKSATVVNDADAAGLAEYHFGNVTDSKGTVILLTIGTGIGSALFHNGIMVPNTEFGHMMFNGMKAERFVSNKVRKDEDLAWDVWALRLNSYLEHLDFLFSPSSFILGGGISKKFEKYKDNFNPELNIVPAKLFNNAGIVGAALATKN